MASETLLGIDLGTTGAKVVLIAAQDGQVVGTGFAPYPLRHPHPGWAEQDPAEWWAAVGAATKECLAHAGACGELVASVALSGQMHGAVLLDAENRPVRPCIIWSDQRSAAECDEIHRRIGLGQLVARTGNPALTGFTAAKVLWVRNHEPKAFARAKLLLLPKDYIRWRMTGEASIERSDAAGTNLLDIHSGEWAWDVIDGLELHRSLFPPINGSTSICGHLTSAAATHLGLPAGLPVAGGGADNVCGATGAGVIAPAQALLSIGTSGVILAPTAEPHIDTSGPLPRVHTFTHAAPHTWYLMGVTQAAGLSLRWARDVLSAGDYDAMTKEAEPIAPGSDGLLFLPYLQGERTPLLDSMARGAWLGLTATHTRAHLVRAVLEGVAFSLRDCLDVLLDQPITITQLRATGGGATSPAWLQIFADVLDRPIVTLAADEGPGFGAALLAGVSVGLYANLSDACTRTVRLSSEILPDPAHVKKYRQLHTMYQASYPALRDIMHQLAP